MNTNVNICVTSIRSRGRKGGAIFSGRTEGGQSYVAKCNYHLLPDSSVVDKGQVWNIAGSLSLRNLANSNAEFLRQEQVIEATQAELIRPSGQNIIEWISNSSECAGIGRVKAKRLYDRFGPDLVRLIEVHDTQALTEIVNQDAAELLCNAFVKYKIADTLLWLDQVGISRRLGQSVINYWQSNAKEKIATNPYSLISFEADWKKVDAFARTRLKVGDDDPRRLIGAIEEVLYAGMKNGHTCLAEKEVRIALNRFLNSLALADKSLNLMNLSDVEVHKREAPFYKINGFLQPTGTYLIERYVARRLYEMAKGENETGQQGLFSQRSVNSENIDQIIKDYQLAQGISLTEEQQLAVRTSAVSHLSLILGGAGTGKTTVLKALYSALGNVPIFQLALAGRAAQRMAEATGREAMTITGFLTKIEPASIEIGSVVVVDEVSMVDVILMYRLLKHLPSGVRLILVGDPSQLPPIGPGLVLHALEKLPSIPQTELKIVKRQSGASGIPKIASAIRAHEVPVWSEYCGKGAGVSFIGCNERELESTVKSIYEDLGGKGVDFDVQIISITRANIGGVKNLNATLHNSYHRDSNPIMVLDEEYGSVAACTLERIPLCVGDLVIFNENDYTLGLRNGSLGKVMEAMEVREIEDPCCRCEFEGVSYLLNSNQIQALSHSYSITVHKSQGSQFKRVVVPVRQSRLLDQTLIYTAVTRGIEQVVLVGDLGAIEDAIRSPAIATKRSVMLPAHLEMVCHE